MPTRGLAIVLVAVLVPLVALGPGSAASERTAADFKLSPGQKVFWDGEGVGVEGARVPHAELCGTAGPCWDKRIEVEEGGERLRVALSTTFRDPGDVRSWPDFAIASEMIFELQVTDPAGKVVGGPESTGIALTTYGVEVFVPEPAAGIYTVTVIPTSVTDMAFRMRAKLEAKSPTLDPNLRVIPPFEFNFYNPTVTYGPGGGTPAPGASCMVEESEEAIEARFDRPEVCLRYSMGFENAGDGRLDLQFKGACPSDPSAVTTCELQQRRWRSDGTYRVEGASAGRATFHASHGHFHYEDAWDFQLLRVMDGGWQPGDPEPELASAGPGRKLGLEPVNERMADWRRFWPACGPGGDADMCQHDQHTHGDGVFELQAGWGDIYEWNRSGNYVDFRPPQGAPKEGFYVLRAETNPAGRVVETDAGDNLSYALVEVRADWSVRLLERGYGTGPWDDSKKVLRVTP